MYTQGSITDTIEYLLENEVEAVDVALPKAKVEADLVRYAPGVRITGSQMTEEGWTLIIEGPRYQIEDIIRIWSKV